MVKSTYGDTKVSESFGAIARHKNTERVFVHPGEFIPGAVTGTWAMEYNSNVPSLATDDAGTTNVFDIPMHAPFSDAEIQHSVTDRGVKVAGLAIQFEVAASALGAFDLQIWKLTPTAEGAFAAAEVPTTVSFDTDGDDGTEIDQHWAYAAVVERDRAFMDTGAIYVGRASFTDGTASDVNILGATWHLERVEE